MTAFTTANRANLRRWAISGAMVVLVHGAIAAAVVTWRKAIVPAEPPGPVVIELAPIPAAPTTDQAALPPAPAQVPSTTSSDKPLEKVEEKTERKTATRGEESKPVEEPRVTAPVTVAPSESAEGENRADTKAVAGGEASGAVQAGGGGPIDTRIAEQPRLRFKKDAKANDRKKVIMGRPSNMAPLKNFAARQLPSGPGAAGGMTRNAVGMPMLDRAGAASAKGLNAADGAKKAVGATAMNAVGGAATNAVNGSTTNAIGVAVPIHSSATGTNGQRGIGPVASNGTMPNAGINGTGMGISGTAMGRPGSGTGVIGGAAKNVAGAINGTSFRPKP